MKQKNTPYEDWLTSVRNTSPTLPQPDEMTQSILARIHALPSRRTRFLLWAGRISGVAAACLVGLFAWETAFPPIPEKRMDEWPVGKTQKFTGPEGRLHVQAADMGHLEKKYPQLFRQSEDDELLLSEAGSRIAVLLAQRQADDRQRAHSLTRQIESTFK